jgi:hypothetical protein
MTRPRAQHPGNDTRAKGSRKLSDKTNPDRR